MGREPLSPLSDGAGAFLVIGFSGGEEEKPARVTEGLPGSAALFTYASPRRLTTHHHNRFLLILLMSLCFLAGPFGSVPGQKSHTAPEGNAAKDPLQRPHISTVPPSRTTPPNAHQRLRCEL